MIATASALIVPLTLEVIFNHHDLWFNRSINWQDGAFPLLWEVWTIMGVLLTSAWGTDRAFEGLSKTTHGQYTAILSLVGVFVYCIFGVPSWIWLSSMNLVSGLKLVQTLAMSGVILCATSLLAVAVEVRSSALSGMLSSFAVGGVILWFSWGWLH